MNIREFVQAEIDAFATFGFPCLMQRFVLKHGVELAGNALPAKVKRGEMKACFRNASRRALAGKGLYLEGYVMCARIPLLIHHAWTVEGDDLVDVTLTDPAAWAYLGVPFTNEVLRREQKRLGLSCVLDSGHGCNVELMRELDPALVTQLLEVK